MLSTSMIEMGQARSILMKLLRLLKSLQVGFPIVNSYKRSCWDLMRMAAAT